MRSWSPSSALAVCLLLLGVAAHADEPAPQPRKALLPPALPSWLPTYDLSMEIDVAGHTVRVRQRVAWVNRHDRQAKELVFNAHSRFKVPDSDVAKLAKTLELLRMGPADGLDLHGPPMEVTKAMVAGAEVPFHWQEDLMTSLVVPLPRAVAHGEVVVVDLDYVMHLPEKQGRWGQWKGVTYLSNWLPVLAYYDEQGWQPTPFVPWHQPWFNEAGNYRARVVLPADQKVACTGTITSRQRLADGRDQVDISAMGVRDFAFLCSARYQEFTGEAAGVRLHILAFPEHEHFAKEMLRIVGEAIPAYSKWFGPYPWPDFTIAESFFGWNGNECATLVMIDERVFGMPHLAGGYVDYLVSHETCHQWWYNLVGTNGYRETWMDEALATYFAHRLLNQKCGINNDIMHYPRGLEWLPNIGRENYRFYSMYGVMGRGEACAPVQDKMEDFGHVVNLFAMCYDRGSKVVGMIEDRLGEAAFLDFMHLVYQKYGYRMLRIADYQRELEAYTGRSWDDFFKKWLYATGTTDWAVEKVDVRSENGEKRSLLHGKADAKLPCRVTVMLRQNAEYDEQTVLGFCLDDGKSPTGLDPRQVPCQIRIPILPQASVLELDDPPARVEILPDHRVKVEVLLPSEPIQIAVDPDQVLVDKEPSNNFWKSPVRYRITPAYTFLDETDLSTAYDRLNVIAGPWYYSPLYDDPWYSRATMIGLRAGVYRTQQYSGGAFLAYRTDFNDVVVGADGVIDHFPWPHTQVGFNFEKRVATFEGADANPSRISAFGRYVINYSSSLYLPPMEYVETFGEYQENFLPNARNTVPGGERYQHLATGGLHYHVNYLTPYWDPEAGFLFDATYQSGVAAVPKDQGMHQLTAQFSTVKSLPDCSDWVEDHLPGGTYTAPLFRWLGQTRLAARAYGAGAVPDKGEFFTLGGSTLFRGFDLKERQGSLVWVGSLEWRVPLARGLAWDACDHVVGLRNLYGAAFYDVGDAYLNGHSMGPVAHAFGGGLRWDVSWFGFVERTTFRFDVAKTINVNSPVQFWFGIQQPF